MKASTITVDRRQAIKILGWGILGAATVLAVSDSDIVQRAPWPRILPDRITRTVGDTALPIPRSWFNDLSRVSVEGMPLDKARIDSIPMLPVDKEGYCKTGALVQKLRHGITIPDMYDKLGMNYSKTGRRVMARATDWYTLIPENPEKAFFSASKENIPKEFWSREGFETAQRIKLTPYGFFPLDDKAWHKISDCDNIHAYKGDFEPGTYYVGPDGEIIKPEDKDVSMTLENLVLSVNNVPVPYSKIQKMCQEQGVVYKNRQDVPSIPLQTLLRLAGIEPENKALILHANKYAVSIPPWRQEGLQLIFDNSYASRYGTPAKLVGQYLNNAGQIGGIYKIEAKPL